VYNALTCCYCWFTRVRADNYLKRKIVEFFFQEIYLDVGWSKFDCSLTCQFVHSPNFVNWLPVFSSLERIWGHCQPISESWSREVDIEVWWISLSCYLCCIWHVHHSFDLWTLWPNTGNGQNWCSWISNIKKLAENLFFFQFIFFDQIF